LKSSGFLFYETEIIFTLENNHQSQNAATCLGKQNTHGVRAIPLATQFRNEPNPAVLEDLRQGIEYEPQDTRASMDADHRAHIGGDQLGAMEFFADGLFQPGGFVGDIAVQDCHMDFLGADFFFHEFHESGDGAFAGALAFQWFNAAIFNIQDWFDIQVGTQESGRPADASTLMQVFKGIHGKENIHSLLELFC